MKELNVTVNYTVNEEKILENLFEERKQSILELTQVIKRINKPFTMTLTSEWGTGKTYFLKAWQQQLEKEAIPFVYYNAWEFEQDSDPLVALIGNIAETIKDKLDETFLQKLSTSIKNKINKKNILDWVGKTIDIAGNALSGSLSGDIGSKIAEQFKEEKSQTDTDNSLFKLLNKLKDKIHQKEKYNDDNYPIIVMIDELDRCKPDYVISLLERIKHIFTMNGYVFVLSMDQEQLYATVEHVFGFKKDTDTNSDLRNIYLQKFIDINYKLAKPDLNSYIEQIVRTNIQKIPSNWDVRYSILTAYCPELLKYSIQFHQLVTVMKEKNFNFPESDNEQRVYAFQNEIIKLIIRLCPKNLRDFEKKFEKFLMLFNLYTPNSFLTFILLSYIFENEPPLQKIKEKNNPITNTEEIVTVLLNKKFFLFEKLIFYKDFAESSCRYGIEDINVKNFSNDEFELIIFSYSLIKETHQYVGMGSIRELTLKSIIRELEQILSFSKHIELFS